MPEASRDGFHYTLVFTDYFAYRGYYVRTGVVSDPHRIVIPSVVNTRDIYVFRLTVRRCG